MCTDPEKADFDTCPTTRVGLVGMSEAGAKLEEAMYEKTTGRVVVGGTWLKSFLI